MSTITANRCKDVKPFNNKLFIYQNNILLQGASMKNRIKQLREERSMTMAQLAEKINTTQQQVNSLEKGHRKLSWDWISRLASALECHPMEITGCEAKQVPIVGSVGAGKVDMVDCYLKGGGEDYVDEPYGLPADNIVALRVKGTSQEPMLEDGWLIFYRRNHEGVPSDCLGRLCVVLLPDETIMVKKVKLGSKPDHYHLLSRNADTIIDQKLIWAARVLDIRPT